MSLLILKSTLHRNLNNVIIKVLAINPFSSLVQSYKTHIGPCLVNWSLVHCGISAMTNWLDLSLYETMVMIVTSMNIIVGP